MLSEILPPGFGEVGLPVCRLHQQGATPPGSGVEHSAAACDDALRQAQDIAHRVERQGYCLVHLEVVGDVVAFARDDAVDRVPPGYVVYTRSELVELYGGSDSLPISTFRMLHEAKKLGGRVVGRTSRGSPQGGSDGR